MSLAFLGALRCGCGLVLVAGCAAAWRHVAGLRRERCRQDFIASLRPQ